MASAGRLDEAAADPAARATIGIDVGGTFTDFVLALPEGQLVFHKEPSTPKDPSMAVHLGLKHLVDAHPALREARTRIVHGTTLALNAVLQHKVADIALVVSRGNRDVLEIGRARLPSSFDIHVAKERPIVPRDRILEIGGRTDADGIVLSRPAEAELDELCARIRGLGVGAVAITLLNSYVDATLERELVAAIAARLPDLLITSSSSVWPEIREFERTVVACINAQVHPLMEDYLATLAQRIDGAGITAALQLTSSSGGMLSVHSARARPIETMLSGPASGATAAAKLAKAQGIGSALTFDMGGTSADIAVIVDGVLEFTTTSRIGELPLMMPVVGVSSIGAGGGSIVSVDAHGIIKVGPESAGANPGPVAYGLGGVRPTVTDCYLVLGLIDPDGFLGGRIRLDKARAEVALQEVADRLNLPSAAHAAEAAISVATAQMATDLFKLLALKGHEPATQILMPFGGAGPTHANLLAEEAGLAGVAVPPAAATFCALGAALADVRRDFVAALGHARLVGLGDRLWDNWATLESEAKDWLAGEGIAILSQDLEYAADMRYAGQAHNLMVTVPASARAARDVSAVAQAFHQAHEAIYGFREDDAAIEIVAQRLSIIGRVPSFELPRTVAAPRAGGHLRTREVFHGGAWVEARVVRREELGSGTWLDGPLIVEQSDTTTWVLPGWHLAADEVGVLNIERSR
jgi:N-methylhydantoinase A